jgi:DNA-binding SARP family transcriptional activator/Tfp pilus assembly protein PilF
VSLTLNTLGRFEILWDGQLVTDLSLRKSQALLVYLALNPGSHNRSRLAGLLWGDLPETNARRNLRHALHRLRHGVDPAILESDRLSVGLRPDLPVQVDVLDFEALVARADRCRREGDLDAAARHIEAALERYGGDFLAGFDVPGCLGFEEWVARRQARVRERLLKSLDTLVTHWTQRGAYERALRYARRQLALEPLRERAHRQMMTLLALTGQRSAALAQYEACQRILSDELGLEPLEETLALRRAIENARSVDSGAGAPDRPADRFTNLPFVGREEEHATLVRWWEATRRGCGQLTLVEGEAGVGKTRLVTEALRYAETQGALVLQGRCYEFGDGVPYQPIAEALRVYFREEALDLSPIWLAELARLLPSLHEVHPDLPEVHHSAGEAARQRLFEAMGRLLLSLCEAHSTICFFLDDLHWADQATLDLLHYLVRHLNDAPIWLVGTYRPEETGLSHPLTRLRQGLSRDRSVARLPLVPLGDAPVRVLAQSLVGEGAGSALGEFLHRESEGNAFILVEMVSALEEEGALVLNDVPSLGSGGSRPRWTWIGAPAAETLPASVQDIVLQRVGRLSQAAQRLLTLVAVMGQQFDVPLLQGAAGRDGDAVDGSLDEWLARRLVQQEGPPACYDFTHDKIRAVVYRAIQPGQRQRLHRRVGQALEQRFGSRIEAHAASLAYHFEQAGVVEKALLYLPLAAAKAAAVYANQQALDYYRRALALCPPSGECRWRLLLQQADLLILVGAYEAAIAACRQVVDGGPAHWQARAYSDLARIYRIQRDYDAARRCATESERLTPDAGTGDDNWATSQRAQILQTLGEIEREQTNLPRAQELFEAALVIYQESEDARGVANCFKGLGDILSARGRYAEACDRYERAVATFKALGDKQSASVCLRGITMAIWRQGAYAAARAPALESLEVCRTIGDRQGEAASLINLGVVAIAQGDYDETQRCLSASVAIYRELGLERRTARGLHNLGIAYMESGDMAASRRCLEQALEINSVVGSPRDQALDLGWLGKLHWLCKDYEAAIDCLDLALALDGEIDAGEEEDWHLIWRAAVACETGDLSGARSYLQRSDEMVGQGTANLKAHDVMQWDASIHLAEGDVEAAQRLARLALAEAEAAGAGYRTLGELLIVLGRSLAADPAADDTEIHRCFEEALAVLPDVVPNMHLRGMTLYHYGNYLTDTGRLEQAAACLDEAREILQRIGVPTGFMERSQPGEAEEEN